MSDINFLDSKKNGDASKPKNKDNKREKIVWSSSEKETEGFKNFPFSFLPFTNKKEPVNKNSASVIEKNLAVDKNKIKQSREEILNLIKLHKNLKPLPKEKSKNFLTILFEKFRKQPEHKQVLIDYQQIYNREKEHKSQVGQLFKNKPVVENKPTLKAVEKPKAEKFKNNWFNKLTGSHQSETIALNPSKNETTQTTKLLKLEEIKPIVAKQPAPAQPIIQPEEKKIEVKKMNTKEKEPIYQNEVRQRVLETNLMQGELVTFFDWSSKITVLVSAILISIFIVGAAYYGLAFYQKSNQAKSYVQAQKFAQLKQTVAKEESGLQEIYDFQIKLKTVSQVFEQHLYWTNFFKFLEDNMIKGVYFINFDGDTSGNYAMDTLAANYGNIAEQVNIFRNNKYITAVQADGGEMAEGGGIVKFILKFSIIKSIFTQ